MDKIIIPGAVYQHYSGKLYRVLGIGHHSETLEELVIYQGLYDCSSFGKDPLWVRPKAIFLEEVTINGIVTERFKLNNSSEQV